MKKITTLFLMILLFAASLMIINACDDAEKDPDAGEDASVDASDDDSGPADGFTCLECHIDKDLLLADLEADPLPEPEDPPESEGEG